MYKNQLNNPLLIQKIIVNISNTQILLKLRLVSKLWKYLIDEKLLLVTNHEEKNWLKFSGIDLEIDEKKAEALESCFKSTWFISRMELGKTHLRRGSQASVWNAFEKISHSLKCLKLTEDRSEQAALVIQEEYTMPIVQVIFSILSTCLNLEKLWVEDDNVQFEGHMKKNQIQCYDDVIISLKEFELHTNQKYPVKLTLFQNEGVYHLVRCAPFLSKIFLSGNSVSGTRFVVEGLAFKRNINIYGQPAKLIQDRYDTTVIKLLSM